MKKMSKVVVLLMAVLMLASIFSACNNSGTATSAPVNTSAGQPASGGQTDTKIKGTVNLLLTGWQENDNQDAVTKEDRTGFNTLLKNEFAPNFPDVKVTVSNIPWENAVQKQRTMLMSKKSDVMYVGGGAAPNFYLEGLTANLQPYIDADETYKPYDIFEKNIFDAARIQSFDGKDRIALPAIGGIRMTVYDKKLFEDWGQEVLPEKPTPEIVLAKAKAMTGKNPKTGAQNYGVWFNGQSWQTYIPIMYFYEVPMVAEGSSLAKPKEMKWTMNTDQFKKVFHWYRDVIPYAHPSFVNNQGNANFATENNENAMYLDYNGAKAMSLWRVSGRKDTQWIDRFVPAMGLGKSGESWYPIDPIIMRDGIDEANQKAAWEVAKFTSGPVTQKWNYLNYSAMPTCKPDFLFAEDVYAKMNLKIMEFVHQEIYDQTCNFFITDVAPAISAYIADVATGKAPTDEALGATLDSLQTKATDWSQRQVEQSK